MRFAAGVFRLLLAHCGFLSLALDFTVRSRATFRKPDAYGQVYFPVLHLWIAKVESHRGFWKCNVNLLECGKCNREF